MSQVAANSRLAESDAPSNPANLHEIAGTWFNTNQNSPEIVKAVLKQVGGGLTIQVYGRQGGVTVDWGQVPVTTHVAPEKTDEVSGFEAHVTFDGMPRHLAANVKLGVLVIQCYNHCPQGKKGSYFTREFFHQQTVRSDTAAVSEKSDNPALPFMKAADLAGSPAASPSDRVELDDHLGVWHNTHQHTRAISHLELVRDGDAYLVHVFGISAPADWGTVPAVAYAENVDSRKPSGFFADYDFGFMQMRLAANFNKGLLIVAGYSRFRDDDGRSSYFTREFFYHERPSDQM